jgi:hypothetical protein
MKAVLGVAVGAVIVTIIVKWLRARAAASIEELRRVARSLEE